MKSAKKWEQSINAYKSQISQYQNKNNTLNARIRFYIIQLTLISSRIEQILDTDNQNNMTRPKVNKYGSRKSNTKHRK